MNHASSSTRCACCAGLGEYDHFSARAASFFSRAHWALTSERGWGASLNPTRSMSLETRLVGAGRAGPVRSASDAVGEQPGLESGGLHRERVCSRTRCEGFAGCRGVACAAFTSFDCYWHSSPMFSPYGRLSSSSASICPTLLCVGTGTTHPHRRMRRAGRGETSSSRPAIGSSLVPLDTLDTLYHCFSCRFFGAFGLSLIIPPEPETSSGVKRDSHGVGLHRSFP